MNRLIKDASWLINDASNQRFGSNVALGLVLGLVEFFDAAQVVVAAHFANSIVFDSGAFDSG